MGRATLLAKTGGDASGEDQCGSSAQGHPDSDSAVLRFAPTPIRKPGSALANSDVTCPFRPLRFLVP